MKSSCNRTELAAGGTFRVDRCTCGTINLHIGALTLRLEPSAMDQLATVLGDAALNHRKLNSEGFGPQLAVEDQEPLTLEELGLPMGFLDDIDKIVH